MTDDDLISAIRQHDTDAFEALCARYLALLRGYLLPLVRDREATEDLLQEVFLRLWTRAEQWDGRGSVRAWLFRIATNLALNHLRSVRRRRQHPLMPPQGPGDEEDEAAAPGWMVDAAVVGPEALVEMAERRALLRRLVTTLSQDKQDVLRLVYEAEMETREVAEQLGIPLGTVKSRLHYGTRQLAHAWHEATTES